MLILPRPSQETIKQQRTNQNCVLHFYQVYANIVCSINEAELIITVMASPQENINTAPKEIAQIEQLAHNNIPEHGLVATNYQLNKDVELPGGLEVPPEVGIRAGALALQDTFKDLSFDELASYGSRPPLSEPQTIPIVARKPNPALGEDGPASPGSHGPDDEGELVEAEIVPPEDNSDEEPAPDPDGIPEVEEVPEADDPEEPETPPEPEEPEEPVEVDPFFSPEVIEEPLPIQLQKIQLLQRSLAGAKQQAADMGNNFGYDSALANNASDFIDLLASPVTQKHLDKVPLTQEGLEMITYGLGALPDRPAPDRLFKLSRVFVAQNIQAVVPFTIDPNTKEKIPDHHAAVTQPRYISTETGQRFGPFLSPQEDSVAKAVESLNPATWVLNDQERNYLEHVAALSNLVVEQKPYDRPPRRILAYGIVDKLGGPLSDVVHTRKEVRHNASLEEIDPDDYDVSRRIVARYQKRLPENVGDLRTIPNKLQQLILQAAQQDAIEKLRRDDELRAMI